MFFGLKELKHGLNFFCPFQAAKLVGTFRDYKQREATNLLTLYANKLQALESALLEAREELFSGNGVENIKDCLQRTADFEREVKTSSCETI